jgi:hypothetical protein
MKTNDLKRGSRVMLANGWAADIMDNMKGNTRLAKVYGFETEIGSVYSHDIVFVMIGGEPIPIEHTKEQLKLKDQIERIFN